VVRPALDAPGDADLMALLGLDRDADLADVAAADREHPDVLLLVSNPHTLARRASEGDCGNLPSTFPALRALRSASSGTWQGRANPLSPEHVDWPIIDDVAQATWKPETEPMETFQSAALPSLIPSSQWRRPR
jgi:hypothetical protein